MPRLLLLGLLVLLTAVSAALLTSGAAARGHGDPADASGPLDLRGVDIRQSGRKVVLEVRTSGTIPLRRLNRRPNVNYPKNRFICLHLHRSEAALVRQLCFGRLQGNRNTLGYARLAGDGSVASFRAIAARVKRPAPNALVARFSPKDAELRPHRYHWQFLSRWSGEVCPAPAPKRRQGAVARAKRAQDPCLDRAPAGHKARFHLRPVQPVRCTDGPSPRFHGSHRHKRVALTFDDGPSPYTPKILSVLRHKHAKATFFQLGDRIPGGAAISRAVLESGNELGNHSLHHEYKPGRGSMAETTRRIRSATGFTPCLFRPPYGAYDSRVVGDARSLGMATIVWDVDPVDWSTPGADAIYSRVVSNTRPGSIVLMHDGGGNRSQTVAALPRIINTLRDRGYRFVTVTKLLHEHFVWRPVG